MAAVYACIRNANTASITSLHANMEMSAPLVNDIVNNALFHSSLHIHQMLHQITHILHFVW